MDKSDYEEADDTEKEDDMIDGGINFIMNDKS